MRGYMSPKIIMDGPVSLINSRRIIDFLKGHSE